MRKEREFVGHFNACASPTRAQKECPYLVSKNLVEMVEKFKRHQLPAGTHKKESFGNEGSIGENLARLVWQRSVWPLGQTHGSFKLH